MQVQQLPLGIVEGIAQGKIYVLVSGAVDMKTVGVDLRTGHGQVNLDYVGCPAVAMVARAFERHVASRDLAEALQPGTQFPCTIFEGTRAIDVAKH
jgi:hypothetical protein